MITVRVAAVALDSTGQHVILLKPQGEEPGVGTVLPIWIGAQEATSILVAVERATVPRPLAHDLMRSMLDQLGASVREVAVTRITDGTFYAEIALDTAAGERIIDARPSDAIALACRSDAPIRVAEDVLAEAGVLDTITESDDDADEDLDEFKRFLEDVDPDDFRG